VIHFEICDGRGGEGYRNYPTRPIPGSGRDRSDNTNPVLGWLVVVLLLAVAFAGGWYLMSTDSAQPPTPVEFHTASPAPSVSCVCACVGGAP
jgi:hypothetical protein